MRRPLAAADLAPDAVLARGDAVPFLPDALLPAQLSRGARQDSLVSGPRALMLALLADAVRCLLRDGMAPGLAADAEAWIRSDDREWPMSFCNVCEALGYDADRLRAGLLARRAALATGSRRSAWRIEIRRSLGATVSPRERSRRAAAG